MGIKGTVKRNQDGDFIHANVDLDVVVTEEPEYGDLTKPAEMFRVIEHFCLGRRRLYIFGGDAQIRPGKPKDAGLDWCQGLGYNMFMNHNSGSSYWSYYTCIYTSSWPVKYVYHN